MIIAGLDAALRKSGAAIMDGDRFIRAEAFTAKGEGHGEAFHEFRTWWRVFLVAHRIECVAIEEPLRSDLTRTEVKIIKGTPTKVKVPITNQQTLFGLYGVRAHAIEICAALNIRCFEVNNQDWREVIHNQRKAPKGTKDSSEWWKQRALARCKQLGWAVPSKDAAEAALICEWLRIRLSPLGKTADLFEERAS